MAGSTSGLNTGDGNNDDDNNDDNDGNGNDNPPGFTPNDGGAGRAEALSSLMPG